MILVIAIAKKEIEKHLELDSQLLNLSSRVDETDNSRIYYPMSGQLVKIVNVIKQHRILYELKMQPIDHHPLSS